MRNIPVYFLCRQVIIFYKISKAKLKIFWSLEFLLLLSFCFLLWISLALGSMHLPEKSIMS